MFGFLKPKIFTDQNLGEFTRKGSNWKGLIALDSENPVRLCLSGTANFPDSSCLNLAYKLPDIYQNLMLQMESHLFEHYEPYRDSFLDSDLPEDNKSFPVMNNPGQVWQHVSLVHIRIEKSSGSSLSEPSLEFAYETEWDEEHTVAATFERNKLKDFCGSIRREC